MGKDLRWGNLGAGRNKTGRETLWALVSWPPLMLTTADHDDRVVPLHSFKHAATLQHLNPGNPNPLIIRIDKKAGHGAGKSTEKRCVAGFFTFLWPARG